MNKKKLIQTFDRQANMYEWRRKKLSERKWREGLIRCAKGRVLEVAVGAGANFHFYHKDINVTAVDFSEGMINKAKVAAADNDIHAEFILSDIETLSFPDDSFDTIVSTLSLCGYVNPLNLLRSFNKWCKADGQILLMEHGISTNRFIASAQTVIEPVFLKVAGCHLKRDMIQIIQNSHFQIHRMEHYLFDSVHLVWAAPDKPVGPSAAIDRL